MYFLNFCILGVSFLNLTVYYDCLIIRWAAHRQKQYQSPERVALEGERLSAVKDTKNKNDFKITFFSD